MGLIYSISFGVLASALTHQYGFPLDDSWIHQTVARNFAHYGVLGFVAGKLSSGTSSPLWACILASNYRIFHLDPIIFNLVLSWITLLLIGGLLFSLAHRDGLSLQWSLAFAAAPSLCGNFIWLGIIGMEHLLFIALTLASIYAWFNNGVHSRQSAIFAGFGAGLLLLTRPEAMVFGPLLAMTTRTKRPSHDKFIVLAIWAVCLNFLFILDLHTSHSLMPVTMQGRIWLDFHRTGGPHSLTSVLNFLSMTLLRLSMQFSLWFAATHLTLWGAMCHMIPIVVIAGLGLRAILAKHLARIGFLFVWALVDWGVYLVVLPAVGNGGRYQPLNLLLLFPCLLFGISVLFRFVFKSQKQWIFSASCIALVIAGSFSLQIWRQITILGIAHIHDTHGRISEWMLHNLPPDATIAAFDIGRISFAWRRNISDLGGLVDPSYVPYLKTGQVPEYLKEKRIQYVILPGADMPAALGFSEADLIHMRRLALFCSADASWMIGFMYTGHAYRCQQLYQLY